MKNKNYVVVVGVATVCLIGLYLLMSQLEITKYSPTNKTSSQRQVVPTKNEEANVHVLSPLPNETISLPIRITGEARVFENQLQYRLIECDGNILQQGIMTAQSPDMGIFGPFEKSIHIIPDPQGTYGCLEVFSSSPKDGSDINLVQIPVLFDVAHARKVYVYFSTDKSGEDCQTVFPVLRYASQNPAIARITLEELLQGPSSMEKERGYQTALNTGVSIQKLTIQNGVARIDFDKQLEEAVGGSCRVSLIRSQIEKTLMQYPTVNKVIISIDGRTEDILQP